MKGSVDLQLSSQAQQDVRNLGRVARRLLPVVIRDQLVASARGGHLTEIPQSRLDDALQGIDVGASPLESTSPRWFVMPIVDDYAAIVRPYVDDGGITGALVARVLETSSLPGLASGFTDDAASARVSGDR